MIKDFKCKETKSIFNGLFSKKLPQNIQRLAERKLIMLHRAAEINDLRVPPANRLETLSGNRCLSSKLSPKLNLFFCSNFL